MKKDTGKKVSRMSVALYAILFILFNIVVFVVFDAKTPVFWISYGFMTLAFVVQIVSMVLALRTYDTESVFMGIPLASLSFYYFFAAMFTGVVFMVFQVASVKLAVIIQILILGIYVIVAILATMSREVVQDVNDNVKEKAEAVKILNVNVDVLIPQVSDPALKKALKRVSETIKYSDPMSNTAVQDIEQQIMGTMNELRIYIENDKNAEAIKICKDIEVLFLQRNNLLKATK